MGRNNWGASPNAGIPKRKGHPEVAFSLRINHVYCFTNFSVKEALPLLTRTR